MMRVAEVLRYEANDDVLDARSLEAAFEFFLRLDVPYETVSNLREGVLVKDASQMLESVAHGLGGHCVEHAVLLVAFLRELGFDATYVNADAHDRITARTTRLAKPLVLVRGADESFVCDPYYRRVVLRVPREGELLHGRYRVRRTDEHTFFVQALKGDVVVNEDEVHETSTIDDRRRLFEERYASFSPFGVTAPYFQVMSPERRAVYYDPQHDMLLVHDAITYHHVTERELEDVRFVPEAIRRAIPILVERNRATREAALRFFRAGAYLPHYTQLRFVQRRRMVSESPRGA